MPWFRFFHFHAIRLHQSLFRPTKLIAENREQEEKGHRNKKIKKLAHIHHYWQTEVAALRPGVLNPGPVTLHETRLSPLSLDNPPCWTVRSPIASFRLSAFRGCIKSLSALSPVSRGSGRRAGAAVSAREARERVVQRTGLSANVSRVAGAYTPKNGLVLSNCLLSCATERHARRTLMENNTE